MALPIISHSFRCLMGQSGLLYLDNVISNMVFFQQDLLCHELGAKAWNADGKTVTVSIFFQPLAIHLAVVSRVHDVYAMRECANATTSRQDFVVAQVEGDAATIHVEAGQDLKHGRVRVENHLYGRGPWNGAREDGNRARRPSDQHSSPILALGGLGFFATGVSTRFEDASKFCSRLFRVIANKKNVDVRGRGGVAAKCRQNAATSNDHSATVAFFF